MSFKLIDNTPKQTAMTFAHAWKYIAKRCPDGVLADGDRMYLEVAASLFVEFRSAPGKFHPAKLQWLMAMLSNLGTSPADANRVSVVRQRERDDFDD